MPEFCVRLSIIPADNEAEDENAYNRMDVIVDADTAEEAVEKSAKKLVTNTPAVRARVFLLEECRRYDVVVRAGVQEVQDW